MPGRQALGPLRDPMACVCIHEHTHDCSPGGPGRYLVPVLAGVSARGPALDSAAALAKGCKLLS